MREDDSQRRTRVHRGPVRRVRIEVSGDTWRITRQTRIERMTIQAAWWPKDDRELRGGSYVEVTGPGGEVLYRQRLADPTDASVELFDGGGRIHREDNSAPHMIDVLIPDDRRLGRLRLVAGGAELAGKDGRKKPAVGGIPLDVDGRQ
jgi:hypothetical protein